MAQRKIPPADPFQMFKHAARFVETDEYLRTRAIGSGIETSMAVATMLLGAFAIELLLKTLLILENREPPATHRLNILFRQVGHKRRRRIIEAWETQARPRLKQFTAEGVPTDLPNALVHCGDAFDRLRYPYEEPRGTTFYVGGLGRILLEEIATERPEWIIWKD